jgi:hypothetical protein
MENEFGKSIRGALLGGVGNHYQFEDWVLPFGKELTEMLVEAGFDESLNYTPEMESKSRGGKPWAVDHDYDPYVKAVIFVSEQIAAWGVGKVCELLVSKIVQAVKNKLSANNYTGRFEITIVYSDDLAVVVDSPVQSEQDVNLLGLSISEAQKRATIVQQFSKTTNRKLVYTIRNGSLSDEPTIID